MNGIGKRTIILAGLILTLGGASGWAAGPPNNDVSDVDGNTAGGTAALVSNTGSANTAFGDHTLFTNSAGSSNTAVGFQALSLNSTGNNNTATGSQVLEVNTTGSNNTATGGLALFLNTTGSTNTATGAFALEANTTGSANTATGTNALHRNTTGGSNTGSGAIALYSNTTGAANTALGASALSHTATGTHNLALGYQAGVNLTSGSNNIYLGHPGAVTESNTLRLGQTQTRAVIAGVASTHLSGSPVLITSSGLLGIQASSARYKRDITDMGAGSQGLRALRPVTFHYIEDPEGARHYGLLAEEVAPVYPELVTRSANGTVEGVQYHELIPMLLNELQHQQQALAELAALTARLHATLLEQTAALTSLRAEREEAALRVAGP